MLKVILIGFVSAALGLLVWTVISYGKVERFDTALVVPNHAFPHATEAPLKLAVISDIHADDSPASYDKLQLLVDQVLESQPDFILLLGDYTQTPDSITSLSQHADTVGQLLGGFAQIPTVAVLGNYENWSSPGLWSHALTDNGIKVLRNEVALIGSGQQSVCFRGLGDAFTDRLRYVDFPAECKELPKITLTHDPAGAFHPDVEGVVFAGHTHCGQIRLPIIGSPWVPSDAPDDATCGLYEDADRFLWVSSGVGTSILPIRLGAQSQWDLIEMSATSCATEFCPGILNTWHQNELCLGDFGVL
ncbi:metallophosphoesterase [Luminiphilus sp.]|nr:metallophosphoesterase [Luminiphilus sp.]